MNLVMMIIHILVDTLHVLIPDEDITGIKVEYFMINKQIYLYLVIQVHNSSIQISKHLKYIINIFHELLFMLRL